MITYLALGLGLILGLVIGVFGGVLVMCMMSVASEEDERLERQVRQ